MEKTRRSPFAPLRVTTASLLLPLLLAACGKAGVSAQTSNFSDANRTTMSQYEDVRAALAADDLSTAKRASGKLATALKSAAPGAPASPLLEPAEDLASAPALDKARQAFKKMSAAAIQITSGVSGYYVINCPMTPNGDWVQTSQTVDNPYMGKIMHDCGVVKK